MLKFTNENGTNSLDTIEEITDILSLLGDTLCFNDKKLSTDAQSGLFLIFNACVQGLKETRNKLSTK